MAKNDDLIGKTAVVTKVGHEYEGKRGKIQGASYKDGKPETVYLFIDERSPLVEIEKKLVKLVLPIEKDFYFLTKKFTSSLKKIEKLEESLKEAILRIEELEGVLEKEEQ